MTLLAPTLEAFFTQHLAGQRQASPRTIGSYRDTWRLFLGFTQEKTGTAPAGLDIAAIDAGLVSGFLAHLENGRGNTARTRNARLAALRSFFKFAALHHPEHAATIARVLAIPAKKHGRTSVSYLTAGEVKALLTAPDTTTWHGRRDHALLALAVQTGLRSSELTGLTHGDVQTGTGPTVRSHGKGRKDRVTPLTTNVAAMLRNWLREQPADPGDPLFPTRTGRQLSSDAVQDLVRRHAATAAADCPSIQDKNVTPHTLRHSAAMALLQAGVDPVTIALWMGHESPRSTQPYIHADLNLKEKALARTSPPTAKTGRYRPPDKLLAFLESLGLCRSRPRLNTVARGLPGDRRHNRGPGIRSSCGWFPAVRSAAGGLRRFMRGPA
jgi:integrase/recombinase XerD